MARLRTLGDWLQAYRDECVFIVCAVGSSLVWSLH